MASYGPKNDLLRMEHKAFVFCSPVKLPVLRVAPSFRPLQTYYIQTMLLIFRHSLAYFKEKNSLHKGLSLLYLNELTMNKESKKWLEFDDNHKDGK